MSDRNIKAVLDHWLAPVARRIDIPPNLITAAALLAMAAGAGAIVGGQLPLAAALILVSGALDVLDGAVARASGRASRLGALLDRVSDRAGDGLLIAAPIVAQQVGLPLGLYALLTVLLGSYVSACLEAATGSPIGERLSLRALRLLVLAIACLLGQLAGGMLVVAAIGTWALASRLWIARRVLR